jgi:hypothetical protein
MISKIFAIIDFKKTNELNLKHIKKTQFTLKTDFIPK